MASPPGADLLDAEIRPYVAGQELGPLSLPQMREAVLRIGAAMLKAETGRVHDRVIPGPNGPVPIRLYEPPGRSADALLIYLRGSGWVLGNIDSHDHIARSLCVTTGFTVASVDYRLAPEHKFPAALLDAEAATAWLLDHAETVGCSSNRVAILGESAGGSLAAVVAQRLARRDGPRLQAQVLVYAATDARLQTESIRRYAEAPLLDARMLAWCRDQYLNDVSEALNPDASPILRSDLRDVPPAFVMTAEVDPLCDDGELYAQRLAAAGVPVVVTRYLGLPHGFLGYPLELPRIRSAFEDIHRTLRYLLRAQTHPAPPNAADILEET